jgi:hypothetical protein
MFYKSMLFYIYIYFVIFNYNPISAKEIGQENKTSNTLIFGLTQPINSNEGIYTPIFFWDHKSYIDDDEINIELRTVKLITKVDHKIKEKFHMGYGAYGTLFAESHGSDLYIFGDRKESETYQGNSTGFLFFSDYRFSDMKIGYQFKFKRAFFEEGEDSQSSFILPPDYRSFYQKIYFKRNASFITEKGSFEFELIYENRDKMESWSLDDNTKEERYYTKYRFKSKIPISYSENNKGELKISGGYGKDLDLLNGFGAGGLASEFYAGGYYRNEFRVKEAIAINYTHEYIFKSDRKVMLFADMVRFKMVDLSYLDGVETEQTIASLGIGFYYGIRYLSGMPVIIRYGEGLNIDKKSKDSHRREIAVAIIITF